MMSISVCVYFHFTLEELINLKKDGYDSTTRTYTPSTGERVTQDTRGDFIVDRYGGVGNASHVVKVDHQTGGETTISSSAFSNDQLSPSGK
jgi:hypothetical protein